MGAVFTVGMDVGVEAGRRNRDPRQRRGREVSRQRVLDIRGSEHHGPGAGDGDTHAATELCRKYADQRKTRCLALELRIACRVWNRKADSHDNLVRRQRGLEQAGEECVRGNFAPLGVAA